MDAASPPTTFDYQGRTVMVRPKAFTGAVDSAQLTLGGAILSGWALSVPEPGEPALTASSPGSPRRPTPAGGA
ncbi:MAG: hypothetical protein HIU92_21210 [Proteobacteria bacterium]|nr:hypothetical protein [Pseudomonadota bacterium]